MIRLRQEYKGQNIDPRQPKWANEIEKMLAGEHRETAQDVEAFTRLLKDIQERDQLRPGVTKFDGGVVDGNRRLAVLRRLHNAHPHVNRYGFFETVILPKDTSHEDLWKIEAGLQLGKDDRWNYSPVNELLKIREGIQLFSRLLGEQKRPGKTAVELVAQAIPGRDVGQIQEMADRLSLIDDYLRFIEKPNQYDMVGRRSERFLEANRVYTAAKNQQYDPKKLAKLQAVLFYLVHQDLMDNWELRDIYDATGGDPKRKGRRPVRNDEALDEMLNSFPEPRILKDVLTGRRSELTPPATVSTDGQKKPKTPPPVPAKTGTSPKPPLDPKAVKATAELAKDKFLATVQAKKQPKPRQLAERARVPLKALAKSLASKEVRNQLEDDLDEREAVVETVEAIGQLQAECMGLLKRSKTLGRKDSKDRSKPKSK
jgi:hypothetical protein